MINVPVQVVIMAGGKGTRIRTLASDIPKPMISVCGKPLLERQIDCLKNQGVEEITIIVGYLGNKICDYFGDGKQYGVSITYVIEEDPLGTAGGLYYINKNNTIPILVINGDILFDINLQKLLTYHKQKKADITLLTHPNNHPYDSALIETDGEGRIIGWLNKEEERSDYKNRVNAGIHVIEPYVLNFMNTSNSPIKIDLDREILKPNIKKYRMYAYDSPEYVKDMGTPERYTLVCHDFAKGLIQSKNLGMRQKAVFLDRDGTINTHVGFITKKDEIWLEDGAELAIKKINQAGYLAIVITNQPVIARGECTLEELHHIHNRIERLLGEKGAYLDDIFYCPHHPDKGFKGERPEYKVECSCRKPNAGLFYKAADKYNIDLTKSFMIGDSLADVEAGNSAGCRTGYIVREDETHEESVMADIKGFNLKEIVEIILHDYN